jgi:hypothetical protein
VTPFHRETRAGAAVSGWTFVFFPREAEVIRWAIRLNGLPDSLNWLIYVLHARFAWGGHPDVILPLLLALSLARGMSNQSNMIDHAFGMLHYFFSYFKAHLTIKKLKPNTDYYNFWRNTHNLNVTFYYDDICGRNLTHHYKAWTMEYVGCIYISFYDCICNYGQIQMGSKDSNRYG